MLRAACGGALGAASGGKSIDGGDAMTGRTSFETRADFVAAIVRAPAYATAAGARRMLWVDPDFADWPLDDPALLQGLTDWLRLPQRRLVLLAIDFSRVARERPRFMAWYPYWTHAVQAVAPDVAEVAELPAVLVVEPAAALELVDRRRWRSHWDEDAARTRIWTEQLDALLQRCAPALPATTLGL